MTRSSHVAPHPVVEPAIPALLDALPAPTFLVGPDGLVRYVNAVWREAVAGHPDQRLQAVGPGTDYPALIRETADSPNGFAFADRIEALLRGEIDVVQRDVPMHCTAGTVWLRLHARSIGACGSILVTHVDVTEERRAGRQTDWLIRHDPLTGLPNRAELHSLLEAALQEPDAAAVAVLVIDVDGFTEVNDSLGHEAGDEILRRIATRLQYVARRDDTVARIGGDEFAVLCATGGGAGAEALADRCRVAVGHVLEAGGQSLRLSVSTGIATALGSTRATDVVRHADLAVHAAKNTGRGRTRLYTPDLLAEVERRTGLATELREAIVADQLVLHYQPVIHLPSGACTGVEALVRWQHPSRGLLGPAEFLPVAEQHDLMVPLTHWVLREVTRQSAAWLRAGLPLATAMNIHPSHLSTGTLVREVLEALGHAGLPPEYLVLELTETAVVEDADRAIAQFALLRQAGVEIAIDDFGSGYSSLGRLASIPAGQLKIDRSLVAFADGERSRAAATIAAVVALGEACGIRSLAEGVETAEQLELVTLLGCVHAQGFHIARPMPAEQVAGWVRDWDERYEGAVGVTGEPAVRPRR